MRRALGFLVVVALVALVVGGPIAGAAETAPEASDRIDAPERVVVESTTHVQSTVERPVHERGVEECAATPPEDFTPPDGNTSEVIGWVDGYWYNQPIEINQSEGLDDEELDAITARTAARYEALRCWTFDELPPVEIQDREAFVDEQASLFETVEDEERQFDNAKLEALLMVPTELDSVEQREANRGGAVLGYYDPVGGDVVLISEDELQVDEVTLAHELGHALQDQRYDLTRFDALTEDGAAAENGLVEGDVVLIEQRYERLCSEDEWECLERPERTPGAGIENWGLYLLSFQPYSDGPSFVASVYERDEGWAPVDEMYDDPPTTSNHVVFPDRYPDFEAREITIHDPATDEWERLSVPDRPDHEQFGPAGLAATLMAPTFETFGPDGPIYDADELQNLEPNSNDLDSFNPFNYDHDAIDGWEGDRLHVYVGEDDETASIWRIAWTSPADAATFQEKYETLLDHHGGEPVRHLEGVYRFSATSDFDGNVYVEQDGDELVIVHAPSTDAIDELYGLPEQPTDENTYDPPVVGGDGDENTPNDEQPGFGVIATAVVLLVTLAALARRRGPP